MPLKIAHDVLVAYQPLTDRVGQRIGPLQAVQGEDFPYVVLAVSAREPINSLDGFSGLDRCEIQLVAWALIYKDAAEIADLARTAMQDASHLCLSEIADQYVFQQDAGVFRHGYVFQVWK